jgi:hypothetical protein
MLTYSRAWKVLLRSFFDMLIRGVSYAKDPGLNQLAENRLTDEFRVSLPDDH